MIEVKSKLKGNFVFMIQELRCKSGVLCQSGSDNGHTSGVRLFGSDESNTARRQGRRRMRANWNVVAPRLRGKLPCDRACYLNRNKRENLLLLRDFILMERLRNRRAGSFRISATRLVRAAMHSAPLLAGRI
jgi:hypothetical protein